MIKIAKCLSEDYIHGSKLKNFCSDHKMPVSENKPDLLKRIIEYAGEDENSIAYKETYKWILETIKSGSKEMCLKKIYIPDDILANVKEIIEINYPDCPQKDLLSYANTEKFQLINYEFIYNEQGVISKIAFLFSRMVLEGYKEFDTGDSIIYPLYIDVCIEDCFFIARYKSKTNIYKCSENDIIYKSNRFKPVDEAIKIMQQLEKILKIQYVDMNPKQKYERMMYRLYHKYSFTPTDIQNKINSLQEKRDNLIDEVFKELGLNELNKIKARTDLDIFFEKYISINGDMEKIFKEDRDAYLIKVTSDDILQMTRVDTSTINKRPLQCTDAFFDGKKSILSTKQCKILHLCYNRKKGYLGSFLVQLFTYKSWGIVKTSYVPEEEDIQNVLQTIFKNY